MRIGLVAVKRSEMRNEVRKLAMSMMKKAVYKVH